MLAGGALVAVVVALVRIFPQSWWARDLLRRRTIPGRGVYGTRTRGDVGRAALWFGCSAGALAGLSLGAGIWGEHMPNMSSANWTLLSYMMLFLILAGMAALLTLFALVGVLAWRPKVVRIDDVTARAHLLTFVRDVLASGIPPARWPSFRPIRYSNDVLERARLTLDRLAHERTEADAARRELQSLAEWLEAQDGAEAGAGARRA
jgi:hypothetical protein